MNSLNIYYINDKTEKFSILEFKLELEKVGKLNCIIAYKITKYSDPYFINGELYHDLKQNIITIAIKTKNIYDEKLLSFTCILNSCGKNKWRGSTIYTTGLQGEAAVSEFSFA